MHFIWELIWKHSRERSKSAPSVIMHLLSQEIWADIQKHTVGKRLTREGSRCKYASSHIGNFRTHLKEHTGERQNKCNQCEYASIQASHLRIHLIMHSGHKSNICTQYDFACSHPNEEAFKNTHWRKTHKCPQCNFASYQTVHLKTHLKKPMKAM